MTASQRIVSGLSANDLFKRNYNKYLRWSVLAALLLTVIGAWLSPRYEPTPYVLRETFFEPFPMPDEPEPILPDPPQQEVLRPVPNVEVAPIDWPDERLLPWESNSDIFWNPDPLVVVPQADEGFLPSSTNPRLVFQAKPDYPSLMRAAGIEGTVMVQVLVGPDGLVKAVEVIQGIHPVLDRAAANAAKRCRFEPGLQRSIPVQAWVAVPYRFRLR